MPTKRISSGPLYKFKQTQPSGSYQKRNPWQGWRKVSVNQSPDCECSNLKNQEVFTDNCCTSHSRVKKNQTSKDDRYGYPANTGSPKRSERKPYSFDYHQYMKRKCNTFKQQQMSNIPLQCSNNCDCYSINKPNNDKYKIQGAVSSSERLLRLKTDRQLRNSRFKTCPCWVNQSKQYPSTNKQPTLGSGSRARFKHHNVCCPK